MAQKILVADDEMSARIVSRDRLEAEGFEVVEAESGEQAVEVFERETPDLVLMDVNFGRGINGFEATRRIKDLTSSKFVPVVLLTVRDDLEGRQTGLEFGADDYVTKPVELAELVVRVRSMLRIRDLARNHARLKSEHRQLKEKQRKLAIENEALRKRLLWPDTEDPIVGESHAMQAVFALVEKAARVEETVLIRGETGVGKEIIARLIHHNSPRRSKPLFVIDCPSIPESLFESELFGHARGAFSGAHQDRRGILVEAAGSNLFLDEVGDLPPGIQAKLLRFFEDNVVRPVGSNRSRTCNVRILTATNRNLEEMIEDGRFREDLYYRLKVFSIEIPSLDERREDIPSLVQGFLLRCNRKHDKHLQGFSPDALRYLEELEYPGNVRQLKNLVVSASLFAGEEGVVERSHLEDANVSCLNGAIVTPGKDLKSMAMAAERRIIQDFLARYKHDRSKTAEALGITRQGLWKKMKKLGLFKRLG